MHQDDQEHETLMDQKKINESTLTRRICEEYKIMNSEKMQRNKKKKKGNYLMRKTEYTKFLKY